MSNIKEFIKELEVLSRKYQLYIGGCGCCGSPFIETLDSINDLHNDAGYVYEDELNWVCPGSHYWGVYKDKVIK